MKFKILTSFSLFTLISFSGIALIFNLISPPVYGQTAGAWNIERQAQDELSFYFGIGGQPALRLTAGGNMLARKITDLDSPTYSLDPSSGSNINTLSTIGSVGIGTPTPTQKLDVNGNIMSSATTNPTLYLGSGASNNAGFVQYNGSALAMGETGNSAALFVNALNVGIGTATPSQKLDIAGNLILSGGTNATIFLGSATDQAGGFFQYNGAATTIGEVGNAAALIVNAGNVGIGAPIPAARLHIAQSTNDTTGGIRTYATSGYWSAMHTGADNYSYFSNQSGGYVRVDASGNTSTSGALYLGTGISCLGGNCPINGGILWPYANHTQIKAPQGGQVLVNFDNGAVAGSNVQFQVGNGNSGGVFYVRADGATFSSGVQHTVSDNRIKKNIELIPNALEKILQINGVTFEYRDDIPNRTVSPGRFMGVIAQDIEKVAPEAVTTDKDGYKTVAYENLIGLLTEGIKEQQNEINDLKNQVEELKKAVSELQQR